MKFFIIISLCVLPCLSHSNNGIDDKVSHAIKRSKAEFDKDTFDATIKGIGFSFPKKKNGTKWSPFSEEMGKVSEIYKRAFDILMEEGDVKEEDAIKSLQKQQPSICQQPFLNCNPNSLFRTIEGACNNINNPRWGSANQAFVRIVPSNYEDGRWIPRGGLQNSRLPNPRMISTTMHPDAIINHMTITNMVPQFGQFLDHDMTLTPEGDRKCCTGTRDNDCWTIGIPMNDPFYSRQRSPPRCMDFTRSTSFCFPTGSGVREQMNANSAFIDGSQIYGSGSARSNRLRAGNGGAMHSNRNLRGFLPTGTQLNIQVQGDFIAGDDRVNEMPALAVMHNLFLSEHNRIAFQIREKRPGWNDELIFQLARRIVGAELQQITYNEYLPLILGDETMKKFDLHLGSEYSEYNSTLDPTIFNSFATAAYRFGHSLVSGLVRLVRQSQVVGSFNIADHYFVSSQVSQSNGQGYDLILGGLMTQNTQDADPFISEQLTNHLFRVINTDFGSDLVARNLQRGRDHGLAAYNKFRQWCRLPALTNWAQKPDDIRADAWERLKMLYFSVEDIDLYTGGLIEILVEGALTGPTYNCIIANQLHRLKFGDRYFFTHKDQAGSFTEPQLAEIKNRTLGDIICQNSGLTSTNQNAFLVPSMTNNVVGCHEPSRLRSQLNIDTFLV